MSQKTIRPHEIKKRQKGSRDRINAKLKRYVQKERGEAEKGAIRDLLYWLAVPKLFNLAGYLDVWGNFLGNYGGLIRVTKMGGVD